MMNIEDVIKAYEADVDDLKGLGRFEVLNMLTNRDVLEEHRNELTTLQSARLLFADENLMAKSEQVPIFRTSLVIDKHSCLTMGFCG